MTTREELVQAVVVTAELCGTNLSEAAARVLVSDLSAYPPTQVVGALRRCRRELTGRLTVAEIVKRLEDGRPGPEEAWAMIPKDEDGSVVWTDEMARAYGVAAPLLADGDRVAARMAFKEAYTAAVSAAREQAEPVRWTPSLGYNRAGREAALQEAVRLGRLDHQAALERWPDLMLPAPASVPAGVPLPDLSPARLLTDGAAR